MSFYVCVTLLTNHQQICVLTCAQPTWSLTDLFPYSAESRPGPAWPWRRRANNKLGQNRVSLWDIHVWGVNSTVIKHSDHFVWKFMSERVARRCDNTVDKKRLNSCVLEHLFWKSWAFKKIRKCFLQRATNVTFSIFGGWRRQKQIALRAFLINILIRINSGSKILKSCFLHW